MAKYIGIVVILTGLFHKQLAQSNRARLGSRAHGSAVCGSPRLSVTSTPGEIRSPNYPEFYPPNKTCVWKLTAPSGQKINLTSSFFHVENSPGCLFDHVVVYDGATQPSPVLGRFCGTQIINLSTSSNHALVKLVSDRSYTGVGFSLTYKLSSSSPSPRVTTPTYCNSTFTSSTGIILSPNFPLPSDYNTYCTYHIQAAEGEVIDVAFSFFHIERSSYCHYDFVSIFDGDNTDADSLGIFCSSINPPLIRSTGRNILIEYKTDDLFRRGGFNLTYTSVKLQPDPFGLAEGHKDCSGVIETGGTATSPGYPGMYPNNRVCITVLKAPPGKFVRITAQHFKVENSKDCDFDYLAIYDGADPALPAALKFCGEQLRAGTTFTSTGREYKLTFVSDESVSDTGFIFNFTFVSERQGFSCDLKCENGGECVQGSLGPRCDCPAPYRGIQCEIQPMDCASFPCQNGGTCVSHGDTYICTCAEGLKGDHCDIDTSEELRISTALQNQTLLNLGSVAVLVCTTNREHYEISWLFEDDIVLEGFEANRRSIDVNPNGILQILSLNQRNAGKYTCVATAGIERDERTVWVTLDIPCGIEITQKPKNATEKLGKQSHVFKCQARGDRSVGKLEYRWKKDDVEIVENDHVRLLLNFLQIKNLAFDDAGKYTCEIIGRNCIKRKTAWLHVVGPTSVHKICGRPSLNYPGGIRKSARIIGEKYALDGSYPWFVRIVEKGRPFCGGSIIDNKWIVTAAHCIESYHTQTKERIFNVDTTKVYLGTSKCRGSEGIQMDIDTVIVHPLYDGNNFDYDIALIRVKGLIKFSPTVRPVCLEPQSFNEMEFFRKRATGYVCGCGTAKEGIMAIPDDLMEAKLPIQSRDVCKKSLQDPDSMTDRMFCAGYKLANRGGACQGDSGGGFVVQSGQRFVLVGVVSWGHGCDRAGHFGFYTDVSMFYNWVHRIIGQ